MAKKVVRLTESQLTDIVKESISHVLHEEAALRLDSYDDPAEPLLEMAMLNLKDGGVSEFPSGAYRVWVQGDNSPHKPPHMHIRSNKEEWEIKVFIDNGELWHVVNYGRRNRTDNFSDVIQMVKRWFKRTTCMPGRIGTNQEAAKNEWDACND